MKRKAISKKLRFEVFKRDAFTCQYCGRKAPDVVLEVDHISPVKNGGKNDILNLVTSCRECNSGKGCRELSENQTLEAQRKQLKELNEKREQMKWLVKWREEVSNLEEEEIEEIEEIERLFQKKGFSFSNHGKNSLRKWIRKFGFSEVLISAEISINQYLKDESSVEKTFNYIPRICSGRKKELEDPLFQKKNYIIGIIRNKGYCNVQKVRRLLDQVLVDQESEQVLREMSYQCAGSTSFLRMAEEYFSLDIE